MPRNVRLSSWEFKQTDVDQSGSQMGVRVIVETEFEKLTRLEEFDCITTSEGLLVRFYGPPATLQPNR